MGLKERQQLSRFKALYVDRSDTAIFSSSISIETRPPPFALKEPAAVAGYSCQTSLPLSLLADMRTAAAFILTNSKNIKVSKRDLKVGFPYCSFNAH